MIYLKKYTFLILVIFLAAIFAFIIPRTASATHLNFSCFTAEHISSACTDSSISSAAFCASTNIIEACVFDPDTLTFWNTACTDCEAFGSGWQCSDITFGCVAPPPPGSTPTPTPTPFVAGCSSYFTCGTCTSGAPFDCGWKNGSVCQTGDISCPTGATSWQWLSSDCTDGTNRCAASTPTPAPPTPTPTPISSCAVNDALCNIPLSCPIGNICDCDDECASFFCSPITGRCEVISTPTPTPTPTPIAGAPIVFTDFADGITSTTAVLHASINPNSFATTAWFHYDTATSFTTCNGAGGTKTGPVSMGSLATPSLLAQLITGLLPGTTYKFCAVANNTKGTTLGGVLTFLTTAVGATPTPTLAPGSSSVIGAVWVDYTTPGAITNNNGAVDPGEVSFAGAVVNVFLSDGVTLVATDTTDSFGSFDFFLPNDSYFVDLDNTTIPPGYTVTTANDPKSISLPPSIAFNFGIAPPAAGPTSTPTPVPTGTPTPTATPTPPCLSIGAGGCGGFGALCCSPGVCFLAVCHKDPTAKFTITASGMIATIKDESFAATFANPITRWLWNFNEDTQIDREHNSPPGTFTFDYSTLLSICGSKTYTVTLTVESASGSDTTSKPVTVSLNSDDLKGKLQCLDAPGCKCASVDTAIGPISVQGASFVTSIMSLLLGISGGIAVLLIILAGYSLMTSRDNPEAIQNARQRLMGAIAGLLFIALALVLLQVIGVDILHIPGFEP